MWMEKSSLRPRGIGHGKIDQVCHAIAALCQQSLTGSILTYTSRWHRFSRTAYDSVSRSTTIILDLPPFCVESPRRWLTMLPNIQYPLLGPPHLPCNPEPWIFHNCSGSLCHRTRVYCHKSRTHYSRPKGSFNYGPRSLERKNYLEGIRFARRIRISSILGLCFAAWDAITTAEIWSWWGKWSTSRNHWLIQRLSLPKKRMPFCQLKKSPQLLTIITFLGFHKVTADQALFVAFAVDNESLDCSLPDLNRVTS